MSKTPKLLKKKEIGKFLQDASKKYALCVPTYKDELVYFQRFNKDNFNLIEYSNFFIPPAKFFCFNPIWKEFVDFPIEDVDIKANEKALLFGVRPCDAQSLLLLDRALIDNEYYKEKRNNISQVVIGCNEPQNTCFCNSVKGSPFLREGADIFLTDIGYGFVAEDISGILTEHLVSFTDAESDDLKRKEDITNKSIDMIDESIKIEDLPDKLEKIDEVEPLKKENIWQELGETCSNCSVCITLCPTCHCCFVLEDIRDMVIDEIGEEAKKFDPCMLNIFVSAGLKGPLPVGYQRLQRRIMDKFYHSYKNLGQPFCVGCGRCIINCKEKLNLKKVLNTMLRL